VLRAGDYMRAIGLLISKHGRENRRILNSALGPNDAGFFTVINKIQAAMPLPAALETNTKRAISAMLYMAILLTSVTLALGILPGSLQEHDSHLCTHVCDDSCLILLNEHENSSISNYTPVYPPEMNIAPYDQMQGPGVVIANNYTSSDGYLDNYTIPDIGIRGPSTFDNQSILSDSYDQSNTQEETVIEDNDTEESDQENTDNMADIDFPDNYYMFINPAIGTSQQPSAMEKPDRFTLTIVVEGEEGMAVGSQSGHMLDVNPMKSEETYDIEDVYVGEMLTLVASPDNDDHYVHWQAYLTIDETKNFPLNSYYGEPPMSIRNFIMPDADVTIVIKFSPEEPDVPDIPVYAQPDETDDDTDKEEEEESADEAENESSDEIISSKYSVCP